MPERGGLGAVSLVAGEEEAEGGAGEGDNGGEDQAELAVCVGAEVCPVGGYTAVSLAGVRVDTQILWAVMSGAVPLPEIPEFPGALEVLRKKYPLDESLRHAL
ncbi:hypothetical protein SAMN05446589_0111 [Streptomyces sp. OV198]|jgi:hypothetical protein|nr:hypothetical protein SAMN05446589_0111 [Streptomyces sp. OV198]